MGGWLRRIIPAALGLTLALAASATASPTPPPVGGLTPLGGQASCVGAVGAVTGCVEARGVDGASSAVVSPDGRNVYLASYANPNQEGLAEFSRDPVTGALTQLPGSSGCLTADGSSALWPRTCTAVRGFGVGDGRDLVFTSDGRWAYLVNQHAQPADPAPSIMLLRRDPATGALSQLPGTDGCISSDGSSQDGPGTCQTLATLGRPFGISISPDDDFLYVSDYARPARVHVLARDTVTGGLTEVQCLSEAPAPAGCGTGRVLGASKSVVLSPDGRHAYSSEGPGISVLDRDPLTGILTQPPGTAGCISDTGNDDTGAATCAAGRAVAGTSAVAVSPDGATLYAAATGDHGISLFRIAHDGSLTQLPDAQGCITQGGGDGVGGTSCATGRALSYVFGIAISPDGRSLYVITDNNRSADGVAIFALDGAGGAAAQLPGPAGCITADATADGTSGECAGGGLALEGAYDPTVSPDGGEVYVPGYDGRSLTVYRREAGPSCQAVAVPTSYGTPTALALRCRDSDGDPVTTSIVTLPAHGTLSPVDQAAGTVLYTPQAGYSGVDSFTFAGSDGNNASSPATATLTISPPTATAPIAAPAAPAPSGSSAPSHHPHPIPPPDITHLRQSAGIWRELRSAPRRAATMFSFTLNEAADVTLTFTRSVGGRRVRGRCVTPSHVNHHAPPCVHSVRVGVLSLHGRAGQNHVGFDGHLRGSWLPHGRITVTATATAHGERSAARRLSFVISGR